jgi:hypothetical protein
MKFASARFQRNAAAIAVGMLIASVAYAQSSEGSIYGRGKPGDKVTITSTDNGSTRQLTVDASGAFTAAKLPPGNYTVESGGNKREVTVSIGSGTNVSMAAEDTARVVVSRTRNSIDVSSVETNTVFTAEQLRALPVARDVNAVAILAPGVVKGDPDLGAGGLPAFAGASVAENGYYINGFDVTNIRNFLSYANLPFDAIGSQQIKSGGYGAEYGRSLGGVISIATKRGTNTWQSGGAVIWEPQSLRSRQKDVLSKNSEGDPYLAYTSPNKEETLTYDVYAGGPLIKDKLFFFGIIEGRRDTRDIFQNGNDYHRTTTQPNGMIKLDWTPNEMHRVEFTGITNKRSYDYTDYNGYEGYRTSHQGNGEASKIEGGGYTLIGKYTGYLTDALTVSGLVGRVKEKVDKTTGARVSALECPTVYDANVNLLGCWKEPFSQEAWKDPNAPDDEDKRHAWRLDVDYVLGDHTFRGGLDNQLFTSAAAGGTFSGDVYWRYGTTNSSGVINGVNIGANTPYVRKRIRRSTSGEFEVENKAYYIEDNWKITKDLLLYGGMRWESFDNRNGDGDSFVKADKLTAPRLGFSWDANGDSSLKIYGNAGRYYIPVASNTNIRATRGEFGTDEYFRYTGTDPRTAAPTGLSTRIGNLVQVDDGNLPHPSTVADMNLKPMSQDEYILGFQKAITKGWSFGLRGISRKVQNGMDDYCQHSGFEKYMFEQGFKDFDVSTMATCMIVNPGNDVKLMVDAKNDGNLVAVNFPASYTGLGKYTRTYKALEFTLDRPFDGKWGLNVSYVLSQSKGTAEGYVNSIINQEDAGVSQDFDFASLDDGADGYLANDRRHVFKAYGYYMLNDEMRVGFNGTLASGRPISCIGFVPPTAADFDDAAGYSTASSFYCLNEQTRLAELHNRGTFGRTPWSSSVDLSFAYLPKMAKGRLTLQLDVFNVFNQRQTTEVSEVRDFSRGTSNATDPGKNQLDLNWKSPTSFQEPRSVRMTARYEF